MINLIPPHGRTALKHEYILRVASVYGFLLGGVCIAAAALLAPTYVLINSQLSGARNVSADMHESREAFERAFGEIRVANTIMAQLRTPAFTTSVTKVLEDIVRATPSGVRLTSFTMTPPSAPQKGWIVQGTADTRRSLITFQSNIKTLPEFSDAAVPIADLARETQLPFTITITLREPEAAPPSS